MKTLWRLRAQLLPAILFAAVPIAVLIAIATYQFSELGEGTTAKLYLPRSLHEVHVNPEHFDAIAKQAMSTPWVPRNPRKIGGPAEVREILELAA